MRSVFNVVEWIGCKSCGVIQKQKLNQLIGLCKYNVHILFYAVLEKMHDTKK
jgi:hypothetical protein